MSPLGTNVTPEVHASDLKNAGEVMTSSRTVFLIAMLAGCASAKPSRSSATAAVPTVGAIDRRPIAAFAALPAVGQELPDFSYRSLEGSARITRASLRGAPAVVVFWSTHCPYGRPVISQFAALRAQYDALGARMIVLAGDDLAVLRVFEDSAHTGLRFAVAGDSALRSRFDRSAGAPERAQYRVEWVLPVYVVLDRNGRIILRDGGPNLSFMRRSLDSLLVAEGR
jgi:peroxiredoxin